MNESTWLSRFYQDAKGNRWFQYFTIFCRVALALGFIPSGIVKVMGERFASGLSVNHPLGHYFEALQLTGGYYTFIGISQLIIAVLLLVPRTALLGALMYLPIIANICVLAYSTRFEGTRITTFMLLANLYLLCWDYDRIKHILPFKQSKRSGALSAKPPVSNKFPFVFFGCVFFTVAAVIVVNHFLYNIRPGNTPAECTNGCPGNSNPEACMKFCDCIHNHGNPLRQCLDEYNKAKGN